MKAESLMAGLLAALVSNPDLLEWMVRPETILGRVSARTYSVPRLVWINERKEKGSEDEGFKGF